MLTVAAGREIPVLDLHYRLSANTKIYDSGILWQDYDNLSPFGHELFAKLLTDSYLGLLR